MLNTPVIATFPTHPEIIELWQVSRIALAGQDTSRYSRMQYAQKQFVKKYPNASRKQIWLAIDAATMQ